MSCHRMGSWVSTPCPPAALEAAVWVEAALMEAQEAQGAHGLMEAQEAQA